MAQASPLDPNLAGRWSPRGSTGRPGYSLETPYGFLLDLGFVKYVEEIESGAALRKGTPPPSGQRSRPDRRGQRPSGGDPLEGKEGAPVSSLHSHGDVHPGHAEESARWPSEGREVDDDRPTPETREAGSWVTEAMLGLSPEAERERRFLRDTVRRQAETITLLEGHLRGAVRELEELRLAVCGRAGDATQADLGPETADQGVQGSPEEAGPEEDVCAPTEPPADDPQGAEQEAATGTGQREEDPQPNTGTALKSIMKRQGFPPTPAGRKALQFVGLLHGEYESTSSSEEEEEEKNEEEKEEAAVPQNTLEADENGKEP